MSSPQISSLRVSLLALVSATALIAVCGPVSVSAATHLRRTAPRAKGLKPSPQRLSRHTAISGVVPTRRGGHATSRGGSPAKARAAARHRLRIAGVDNLAWFCPAQCGPVMHVNHVYAIYWQPPGTTTMAPGYQAGINQYLSDVAADNGKLSNVYATDTQYFDGSGSVSYSSAFVPATDAVLDTDSLPASQCTDGARPCLTDSQLIGEIDTVVSAKGWPRGLGSVFLLFTPKNVGSCFDSTSTQCAFVSGGYCAYHSAFGTNAHPTLYANMPYGATDPGGCGAGQAPSGNLDADTETNLISHEHNETITDPLGNAWQDSVGNENGDKCAYDYGSLLGNTGTGAYNQLIKGHPYLLQQEWSNLSSGCAKTMLPAPTASLAAPSSALTGQPITLDAGASSAVPGSSISGYNWDFGDGTVLFHAGARQSHSYSTPGERTVTVTVLDANGSTGSAARQISVSNPAPAATSGGSAAVTFPPSSASGSGSDSPATGGGSTPGGDSGAGTATSPGSAARAPSCPARGAARKRCQARHSYKRALARCARLSRKRRTSCRRSAKRAYSARLTSIRCSAGGRGSRRGCPRSKPSRRHVTVLR